MMVDRFFHPTRRIESTGGHVMGTGPGIEGFPAGRQSASGVPLPGDGVATMHLPAACATGGRPPPATSGPAAAERIGVRDDPSATAAELGKSGSLTPAEQAEACDRLGNGRGTPMPHRVGDRSPCSAMESGARCKFAQD